MSFPVYRGAGFLGPLAELEHDPLGMLQRAGAQGDVVRLRFPMPWLNAWLVNSPALIDDALVKHHRALGKTSRGYRLLRAFLGNGLITSEGEFWLRQRRISQPAFHRERIAGLADGMSRAAAALVDSWQDGAVIDLHRALMALTLRSVCESLFSADISGQETVIEAALAELIQQTVERLGRPWILPRPLPTARNRRFNQAKAALDGVVSGIIAQRRAAPDRADLLGMLMSQRDPETGEGMTDAQLQDEVTTLFLAGHETTANALTWTFYLLMQNPACAANVVQEIDAVLAGRCPTPADMMRLPYLHAVMKEALRLYPPIWLVVRVAKEEVQLGELRIPKGGFLFFSPWLLHRRFPEPEAFLPERWLNGDKVEKGAYVPFISGARKCIGDGYAMMQSALVLITFLQRARFTTSVVLEPEPLITLRPKNAFDVTVSKR